MNWRRVVSGAAAAALVSALAGRPAAALSSVTAGPTVTANTSTAAPGQYVFLTGTGWGAPGTSVIYAVICGNADLDQSVDCANANTGTSAVREGGTFALGILVEPPPVPCPCVVRVSHAGGDPVLVPLVIPGWPVAPPRARFNTARAVELSNFRLAGHNGWRSWFGLPQHRRLVFTVTNVGDVTLHEPEIDVTMGRGANPSGFVPPPPPIENLAPKQADRVVVPVRFPFFGFGRYTVAFRVDPIGIAAADQVSTTLIPWGLIVVALVLVQLGLLRLRNRARRRILANSSQPVEEPAGVTV